MNATVSGPSVRAAREAAKLSQSAVAQALGMNRMYYSLFEAGRYVLDDSEQVALREFLDSRGVTVANVEDDDDSRNAPKPQPSAPRDLEREAPASPGGESPFQSATDALSMVSSMAKFTGLDSKRTAGAVATATSALQVLDYPELLAVAEAVDANIEGLPDEPDFSTLPVEQKQVWESRAIGMVICAALYGETWTQTSCNAFRMVREALRKRTRDGEWNVRECGLFEPDDKYFPHLRCHLAPYIAKAAEQRHAPTF